MYTPIVIIALKHNCNNDNDTNNDDNSNNDNNIDSNSSHINMNIKSNSVDNNSNWEESAGEGARVLLTPRCSLLLILTPYE